MNNGSRSVFENQGNGLPNTHDNTMNVNTSKLNEGLFDPEKLLSLLLSHVWLILFCAILSVSAAYYIVNYHLLPVYQSSGTMLISSDESSLPGTGNKGSGGGGVGNIIARSFNFDYSDPVQSAIYLFESRDISKAVAERLVEARAAGNSQTYPSLWQEYPDDSTLISTENIVARIRSSLIIEAVEPATNRLGATSNLIKVTYESYSPYEAAKVVNLALDAYQEKSLIQKQNSATKALSFLGGKKEEVRTQLNNAEDRLIAFQNTNKLVAIDQQAGNSVSSLGQLKAEKQSLEIQLESIDSSIANYEKQMEAIRPGMAEEYSKALGPTIANYQKRLAELRTQRFVLLSNNPQLKANPNSEPQVRKLNQQISKLEKEIQSLSEGLVNETDGYISGTGDGNLAQELSNIQRNLVQLEIQKSQTVSHIQALDQQISEAQSFLDTYPDKQVQLARLETEVQRHKQLLENIIEQESEVALWQQTQKSSGTIYDQANPKFVPVKPNKILWLCFAAMVGMILPVGLLLITDSLSSTINSYEQLRSYPYPLLPVTYDHSLLKSNGWILNKNKGDKFSNISQSVAFYHNADTPIAESYRKIVSRILYANPDSVIQSLLVTSSSQGEGKTTFTGNLGAALAEVDKKVLIIDCDFRRPAAHKLFSMDNSVGVKEVLFDDRKLSEAIKKTVIPNLDVLPSGAKPVSSAKLLASSKFKEMIKVLRPNYDIILFDTPPQGLVSDVSSLMSFSDMSIVAAKFGETTEGALKHTLEELDKTKESNIHLVLTCYKPSDSHDSLNTKNMHKYMYQKYYEYAKTDK